MVVFGPFFFSALWNLRKIAVILFLAAVVTKNADKMGQMRTLLKIMLSVLPIAGLVGASKFEYSHYYSRNCGYSCLYGKSQIRAVYLDGSDRLRIYGCVSCVGELPAGAAGNLEKSGGIREGISDPSGAVRHRIRRTLWERTGGERTEAGALFRRLKMI